MPETVKNKHQALKLKEESFVRNALSYRHEVFTPRRGSVLLTFEPPDHDNAQGLEILFVGPDVYSLFYKTFYGR
jgi:hypothetical protein